MKDQTARGPLLLIGVAAVLFTCLSAFVSQGSVLAVLGPVLTLGTGFLVWRHPLRVPALGLFATMLLLDNPAERPADGMWESPLAPLGSLLYDNLNKLTDIPELRFALLDIVVVYLLAIVIYRRATRQALDETVGTASCVGALCIVALAGVLGLEAWGLARGGDFKNSLWQVRQIAYIPVVALILHGALKGREDHRALGWIVVGIACIKSLIGLYFYEVICRPLNTKPAYVTTHSDSMLFVLSAVLIVTLWHERQTMGTWLLALIGGPLTMLGIIINNRRLAYVELAAALLVIAWVLPRTPLKRAFARLCVVGAPLFAVYCAAGWSSGSRLFRPVQIARSVIESSTDRSAQTRDIENFNLYFTMKQSPLLGTGFGHEYLEVSHADDISRVFAQYRYIPHNSLLGLWAFGGVLGFSALWMPLVAAVYLARRCYAKAMRPEDRCAALCTLAVVIIYAVQAYGDMGVQSWEGTFLVATALTVVGKLAVAIGVWPRVRTSQAAWSPAIPVRTGELPA